MSDRTFLLAIALACVMGWFVLAPAGVWLDDRFGDAVSTALAVALVFATALIALGVASLLLS